LFRYFTVLKELPPDEQLRARYRLISSDLSPYLATDDSADLNLSNRIEQVEDTAYLLKAEKILFVEQRVPVYKGALWMLTDAASGDGVYHFVRRMKSQGRGTMIAGSGLGPTSGRTQGPIGRLTLPGSGLVVDLPLFDRKEPRFRTPALDPDIRVQETLDDLLAHRQPVWESVFKAVRQLKN
jgi:hypothetical protein